MWEMLLPGPQVTNQHEIHFAAGDCWCEMRTLGSLAVLYASNLSLVAMIPPNPRPETKGICKNAAVLQLLPFASRAADEWFFMGFVV